MLIAIDIDDVLADTVSAFARFHNDNYNTALTRDDFFSYDWWRVLGETYERSMDKFYEFFRSDHIRSIVPITGAADALPELAGRHELAIVTSRSYRELGRPTDEWLKKHFPGIFSRVFYAASTLNPAIPSKGMICKHIGADCLIEDMPRFASDCTDKGVPVFLFDAPWNREAEMTDGMERVRSWEDVLDKISNHNRYVKNHHHPPNQ